ncbi:MAG: hypothetical protein AABM66_14595 [Actinomycetota bacterium]
MSGENVEIVRRIYGVWESEGSPVSSGLLDAEIEWVNAPEAVEPGTRRGIEAFASAAQTVADTFEGVRVEIDEFVDAGERVRRPCNSARARAWQRRRRRAKAGLRVDHSRG